MRNLLFLLFLSLNTTSVAQFHTLRCAKPVFQVETESETEALPMNEKKPVLERTGLSDYKKELDYDSLKASCLRKFSSVALPLQDLSLSSRFGLRTNPFTHTGKERHNGIDLRAGVNSEVYAMFAGKVVKVDYDERSGNFVTLQHGDYMISFCHLTKALVKSGDYVQAGDLVAFSGNTGRSTGPHLHITVRRKGDYVNPTILLNYILDVRTEALQELARAID